MNAISSPLQGNLVYVNSVNDMYSFDGLSWNLLAGGSGPATDTNDDAWGGGSDQLWIYEFVADCDNPNNSTFNRVQQLDVSPFDSNFGPTWANIFQPETSQKLDGLFILGR